MGGFDPFVASPDWGHYIIWYFYLGGIAAGAYAVATMIGLFGDEQDRRAVRVAEYLAFPLVNVCGLLLVIDLGRPERFWHMMIQSETFRPMFKWWSPMSAGSMGLSVFGAFSFLSFVGVLAEDRRLGMGRWHDLAMRTRVGPIGNLLKVGGALLGVLPRGVHRHAAHGDQPAGLGPDHLALALVPGLGGLDRRGGDDPPDPLASPRDLA